MDRMRAGRLRQRRAAAAAADDSEEGSDEDVSARLEAAARQARCPQQTVCGLMCISAGSRRPCCLAAVADGALLPLGRGLTAGAGSV